MADCEVGPLSNEAVCVTFDEQAFIDTHKKLLEKIHGGFNEADEVLVVMMAAEARSLAIADAHLRFAARHIERAGPNGLQPSHWLKVRGAARDGLLKINKQLGLDIPNRKNKPIADEGDEFESFVNLTKKATVGQ